ncbi:hypothetical protein GW17_00058038 [Ensete ventricosum]|nr:hypothetical protein GW17_00058038 [Ensete ventricosum]
MPHAHPYHGRPSTVLAALHTPAKSATETDGKGKSLHMTRTPLSPMDASHHPQALNPSELFLRMQVGPRRWMSSASSHSKSHSVEVSARRSRDLSCLFGDSRSIVVLLSSREASPVDSRVKEALATMRSCFNIDSTVVVYRMVEDRKNYYIPPEYELNDPLSGQRPYDGFSSGFNLSTDALEAGLRFALHPMIEACLEGW